MKILLILLTLAYFPMYVHSQYIESDSVELKVISDSIIICERIVEKSINDPLLCESFMIDLELVNRSSDTVYFSGILPRFYETELTIGFGIEVLDKYYSTENNSFKIGNLTFSAYIGDSLIEINYFMDFCDTLQRLSHCTKQKASKLIDPNKSLCYFYQNNHLAISPEGVFSWQMLVPLRLLCLKSLKGRSITLVVSYFQGRNSLQNIKELNKSWKPYVGVIHSNPITILIE